MFCADKLLYVIEALYEAPDFDKDSPHKANCGVFSWIWFAASAMCQVPAQYIIFRNLYRGYRHECHSEVMGHFALAGITRLLFLNSLAAVKCNSILNKKYVFLNIMNWIIYIDDMSTLVRQEIGTVRQQAMTWTNVWPVIFHHVASLYHNGSTQITAAHSVIRHPYITSNV